MGWKTVYINEECKISLSLESMKVKINDDYINIPLQDIQTVIFAHDKMTITLPIINALIDNNIGIIITNKTHDPTGIFLPFNNHSLVFKQLKQQIKWKMTRKKKLWKLIIEEKIKSEIALMELFDLDNTIIEKMINYKASIKNNDVSNQEGIAAKLYFVSIFGKNFTRDENINYNYGMDYGYKIISSYISQYIASRGYMVQLGIHHIGESNPFNLTYDFIEPFRVFVDLLVIKIMDGSHSFTMDNRYDLVDIVNYSVRVNNKRYRLSNAIEIILDSYFAFLEERCDTIIKINYEKLYEFERKD